MAEDLTIPQKRDAFVDTGGNAKRCKYLWLYRAYIISYCALYLLLSGPTMKLVVIGTICLFALYTPAGLPLASQFSRTWNMAFLMSFLMIIGTITHNLMIMIPKSPQTSLLIVEILGIFSSILIMLHLQGPAPSDRVEEETPESLKDAALNSLETANYVTLVSIIGVVASCCGSGNWLGLSLAAMAAVDWYVVKRHRIMRALAPVLLALECAAVLWMMVIEYINGVHNNWAFSFGGIFVSISLTTKILISRYQNAAIWTVWFDGENDPSRLFRKRISITGQYRGLLITLPVLLMAWLLGEGRGSWPILLIISLASTCQVVYSVSDLQLKQILLWICRGILGAIVYLKVQQPATGSAGSIFLTTMSMCMIFVLSLMTDKQGTEEQAEKHKVSWKKWINSLLDEYIKYYSPLVTVSILLAIALSTMHEAKYRSFLLAGVAVLAAFPYWAISPATWIPMMAYVVAEGGLQVVGGTTFPWPLTNVLMIVLIDMQILRLNRLAGSKIERAPLGDFFKNYSMPIWRKGGSILLLAVALFHPQLAPITTQTGAYSFWGLLYLQLFYNPQKLAWLRVHMVRALALMSAAILIWNNRHADYSNMMLHTLIFSLSGIWLFFHRISETYDKQVNIDAESAEPRGDDTALFAKIVRSLERFFVLYWTRLCAMFALGAAFWNPCLFGLGHLMLAVLLVWRCALGPRMYVALVLWVEAAYFIPIIADATIASSEKKELIAFLAGHMNSKFATGCLTLFALSLLLQPVFASCFEKLATVSDKQSSLVSFQFLPNATREEDNKNEDDAQRLAKPIESLENSIRYYVSNWFVEFHQELMIALLVVVSLHRPNIFGLISSLLVILHICAYLTPQQRLTQLLPLVCVPIQLAAVVMDYVLFLSSEFGHFGDQFQNRFGRIFFGTSSGSFFQRILGVFAALTTIRWFLTRMYSISALPQTRFFIHWCRLCGREKKKSLHGFSHVKNTVHYYLGWLAHICLFLVAILSLPYPTVPTGLCLLLSLVFLFNGEVSFLNAGLRKQVVWALVVLILWLLANNAVVAGLYVMVSHGRGAFRVGDHEWLTSALKYAGLSNCAMYTSAIWGDPPVADALLPTTAGNIALFFAVFLLFLQYRLYHSQAFSFLLARMFHCNLTRKKKAYIYRQYMQAQIHWQKKTLNDAAARAKALVSTQMAPVNISDWKKIFHYEEEPAAEAATVDPAMTPPQTPTVLRRRHIGASLDDEMDSAILSQISSLSTASRFRAKLSQDSNNNLVDDHRFIPEGDAVVDEYLNILGAQEGVDLGKSPRATPEPHDQLGHEFDDVTSVKSYQPSETQQDTLTVLEASLEANFYLYTLYVMVKGICTWTMKQSHHYRLMLGRPSIRTSLCTLFCSDSMAKQILCALMIMRDWTISNFDFFVDFLALDAQLYHNSIFSSGLVTALFLFGRQQRPHTSFATHQRLMTWCAIWVFVAYCAVFMWSTLLVEADPLQLSAIVTEFLRSHRTLVFRLLGLTRNLSMVQITTRPTLLLLALSLKRSIMRYLGLWGFGSDILAAKVHYEAEEAVEAHLSPNSMSMYLSSTSEERPTGLTQIRDTQTSKPMTGAAFLKLDEVTDDEDIADDYLECAEIDGVLVTGKNDECSTDDGFGNGTKTLNLAAGTDWGQLFWSKIKSWAQPFTPMPWFDFFVPMFIADFVCLALMIVYWDEFVCGPSDNDVEIKGSFVSIMLSQNVIPPALVKMILVCSFLLVADRALYISKNTLGKLMLQAGTLIGFHAYVFVYMPHFYSHLQLYKMKGLRLWYLSKGVYWLSSALQLRYNYPPLRTETFLAGNHNMFTQILRMVYDALPFISEIRVIVDWTMTSSALPLWAWLKFADIHERLYLIQCTRSYQRSYFGYHRFGEALNVFAKRSQGFVVIVLFVCFLWLPFILSLTSIMQPNTPVSVLFELSLEGVGAPFATFAAGKGQPVTSEEFNHFIRKANINHVEMDAAYFSKVDLPLFTESSWAITDTTRSQLLQEIRSRTVVNLILSWRIERTIPQDFPVINGRLKIELKDAECALFADLLDPATEGTQPWIDLGLLNRFPKLLHAPLDNSSSDLCMNESEMYLTRICKNAEPSEVNSEPTSDQSQPVKERKTTAEKWGLLRQNLPVAKDKELAARISENVADKCVLLLTEKVSGAETEAVDGKRTSLTDALIGMKRSTYSIFVYSNKVPLIRYLSVNVVGLYATVILTIAQVIRLMHADMTPRIIFDDLPNPRPLMAMCQQVMMMRELGDFRSEEAIYWQLIEIFRNPQLLHEMTRIED